MNLEIKPRKAWLPFFAASTAKFWQRDPIFKYRVHKTKQHTLTHISSVSETAFPGVLGDSFVADLPPKWYAFVHKNLRAPCQLVLSQHRVAVTDVSVETSLVIAMLISRVITYLVPYNLFWNWKCVLRCAPLEVWFYRGFVTWRFYHFCVVQIAALWSISTWIRIIFTANELVEKFDTEIKYLTHKILDETECAAGDFSMKENT